MEKFEYVIWGINPTGTSEEILFTEAKNKDEAKKAMKILENKYNCKNVRLQIIDFSNPITKEAWAETIK